MDATKALDQTDAIVTNLIAGLTPEHREQSTPCAKWTVHDLIEHMCQGGQMVAGALEGLAPPEQAPNFLADGPATGWTNTITALRAAATPEALAASHQMPFGEVPGEVAVSVIVADHLVHAWDLAKATGLPLSIDDTLAQWALDTWKVVVPAEGRTGDGFAPVVPTGTDASITDQLAAYTGRQP